MHFTVQKDSRPPFNADAGSDQNVELGEVVILNAVDIGEPATYIWTDEHRNFVSKGLSIEVQPTTTTTYTLEVRAEDDGFKDYDSITVFVNPFFIELISPNPSDGSTVVTYEASTASEAEIVIVGSIQSGVNISQTIEPSETSTTIDVTNFNSGTYSVLLYCDGVIKDVKTLIVF